MLDSDWILLTYKLHKNVENMLVPDEKVEFPRYNWLIYTAYAAYKLYTYYK